MRRALVYGHLLIPKVLLQRPHLRPALAGRLLVSLRLARRDLAGQVPALLKIIDEILVNACDQYTTTRKLRGNKRMRSLDVEVDAATGRVRVTNDGRGIAVKRLKEVSGQLQAVREEAEAARAARDQLGEALDAEKAKATQVST